MDNGSVRNKILSSEVKTLRLRAEDAGLAPYSPVLLSALIPGEKLTFNLYLKVADKGGKGVEFLPFLKEGEAWEQEWRELLARKGLDRLYFQNDDLERTIAYLNNYLQLLNHQSKSVSPEMLTVFSEHLNFSIRRALQSPRLGPAVEVAQTQVTALINWLERDPESIKLVWKILYHDYSLYNHSLNVCLMGVAFFLFMNHTAAESRDMGLACIFHDIGMTHVPQAVIYKEGALTPEERAAIRNHPETGYHLLKSGLGASRSDLPKEVLRLTLEHHENADGSGYPRGLKLARQHPWTPVIRLLDSYDSLTVNRPYRGAFKPFNTLKILKETRGPRGPVYDSLIMKNFIVFLTAE